MPSNRAFWVTDPTGRILDASDPTCRVTGYSRDELLRLNVASIEVAQPAAAPADPHVASALRCGSARFIKTYKRKDGVPIEVEVDLLNSHQLDQRLIYFIRDITERQREESRLQLAANVFTHAREGITITDASGTIVEVNESFTRITGFSREEALGQNPRILKSGRQPKDFYAAMWQRLLADGHWSGEIWNRKKSGEVYAEILTISAVRDETGAIRNYVALFTDVTALKEHQLQLERIAHYDALTALPNRVLFADRLRQAMTQCLRRKTCLAVAYLDIDGFKAVNDEHGHDVGDQLLIDLAQNMKAVLREGDTFARLGGDEFVALLVDLADPGEGEPVLDRLLQVASAPFVIGDRIVQVSASIGVTFYPRDEVDVDQLMRHADQAMYQAKQDGKNRLHVFDIDKDEALMAQLAILDDLRRALETDELLLFYQPKVRMTDGKIMGVEALLRWRHPKNGLLPPGAFLPFVEHHPLSVPLDMWVIRRALTQLSRWNSRDLRLQVSVNVGGRLLLDEGFVARLSELLAAFPTVEPSQLELEVLETSALEDLAKVSKIMTACLDLGVSFALDDFGTGYSSLTYLKHLPAGLLKIDQTFVRDMLGDTDDLAIVEAVVGLASAFRRTVIAEGVETVAHGQLLLPLGCEYAQGYGIAAPMPADDLPGWIATWKPDSSWVAWRDRTPNPDDIALAFAEVEHRHWITHLELFLAGSAEKIPPMDSHHCQFGRWLNNSGRLMYGDQVTFGLLNEIHERVHVVGRELITLHADGDDLRVPPKLRELHGLRNQLIDELRNLAKSFMENPEPVALRA